MQDKTFRLDFQVCNALLTVTLNLVAKQVILSLFLRVNGMDDDLEHTNCLRWFCLNNLTFFLQNNIEALAQKYKIQSRISRAKTHHYWCIIRKYTMQNLSTDFECYIDQFRGCKEHKCLFKCNMSTKQMNSVFRVIS